MAPRATWKGRIVLGRNQVPVKLYSAVEDARVHFHLLHEADRVRVEQHLVNPTSGLPVDKRKQRQGYALDSRRFVVLQPRELAQLQPEAARVIEAQHVVARDALAPLWFERPYVLRPDGDAASYNALVRALQTAQRQIIVHWVMRAHAYWGALRSHGETLRLFKLRTREQVIDAPSVQWPKTRAASDKELKLAQQLVASLEGAPDLEQFHSDYQRRVQQLVRQKAEGRKLRLVEAQPPKRRTGSLESALRASVRGASDGVHGKDPRKGRRHAKRKADSTKHAKERESA